MSDRTQVRLFDFWEILDELLNLLLFGLIGLEMMALRFSWPQAVQDITETESRASVLPALPLLLP